MGLAGDHEIEQAGQGPQGATGGPRDRLGGEQRRHDRLEQLRPGPPQRVVAPRRDALGLDGLQHRLAEPFGAGAGEVGGQQLGARSRRPPAGPVQGAALDRQLQGHGRRPERLELDRAHQIAPRQHVDVGRHDARAPMGGPEAVEAVDRVDGERGDDGIGGRRRAHGRVAVQPGVVEGLAQRGGDRPVPSRSPEPLERQLVPEELLQAGLVEGGQPGAAHHPVEGGLGLVGGDRVVEPQPVERGRQHRVRGHVVRRRHPHPTPAPLPNLGGCASRGDANLPTFGGRESWRVRGRVRVGVVGVRAIARPPRCAGRRACPRPRPRGSARRSRAATTRCAG